MIITNFKWFFSFVKRLYKKPVFLLTLLIIPFVCFVMNISSNQESGIITIGLSSYDIEDSIYKDIRDELKGEATAILFIEYSSPEEAVEAVKKGKVSSSWVFYDGLADRMAEFASGNTETKLCNVYLNQDTVLKKLSREKLHGVLFKNLSYDIYTDFMNSRQLENYGADEDQLRRIYNEQKANLSHDLIEFKFYNSPERSIDDANYLTSPLRGLLAVALIICCLAAMMFSLEDEENGKYGLFSLRSRLKLHFLSTFAASLYVFFAIIIALWLSNGFKERIIIEILYLAIYSIISVGFCVAIGILLKSKIRLCVVFPVLIVSSIVLCPIFINVPGFEVLKAVLPTYYYLKSFVDSNYLIYMIIYGAVVYLLDIVLYKALNKA